jgi:hypothetical protein
VSKVYNTPTHLFYLAHLARSHQIWVCFGLQKPTRHG